MAFTRRINMKKIALALGLSAASLLTSAILVLRFPQPLFAWSAKAPTITVYSDRPLDAAAARAVLQEAELMLSRSPLGPVRGRHTVFVCNTRWRRRIYFLAAPGAGGVNYYPWTTNVFLSGADFEKNLLVSPSGLPDALGRTLDHFIVHEIVHTQTARAAGVRRFHFGLPTWIKEGCAEYVANGSGPLLDKDVRLLLADAPEMRTPPMTPYLRWSLLVAYLLDGQGWSARRLLEDAPAAADVEARLRAEWAGGRAPGD